MFKVTSLNDEPESGKPWNIVFREISKTVAQVSTEPARLILSKINGYVHAKRINAIMGMSGSGKTTLLKVIGGRETDRVSGTVLFQGKALKRSMLPYISYIWQDDVYFPSIEFTVRDQLMFTALVKLPGTDTYEALLDEVENAIQRMHLQSCIDTSLMVVSGGEKRRTSIAKELLCHPKALLMDEGTSGLDSAAAFDLLCLLKELAVERDMPVLCTIHQPSTRAFYLFDSVLFLAEGYGVYSGPPEECMSYLEGVGFSAVTWSQQSAYNPADFVIDILYSELADPQTNMWPRKVLIAAWKSREASTGEQVEEIEQKVSEYSDCEGKEEALGEHQDGYDDIEAPSQGNIQQHVQQHIRYDCMSSYQRQAYAVFRRSLKSSCAVQLSLLNVLQTIAMALLVGLCWFKVPLSEDRVGDIAGFAFFISAYWFFAGMYEGMLEFLPERVIIGRELQSGDYPLSACFIAKTLATFPCRILLPWSFVTVSYFLFADHPDSITYFTLVGVQVIALQTGCSIGALIGCLTVDYHLATTSTTVVSLGMLIAGGFYLKELPLWLHFLGSISAFRYVYRATVQVILAEVRSITCMGGYWIYACADNSGSGGSSGSYVSSINGSAAVSALLGESVDPLGVNISVLLAFCIAGRLAAYISLTYANCFNRHMSCKVK